MHMIAFENQWRVFLAAFLYSLVTQWVFLYQAKQPVANKNMAHLVDWIPAAETTVERQVWLVVETQWPKMPEQLELIGGNHG